MWKRLIRKTLLGLAGLGPVLWVSHLKADWPPQQQPLLATAAGSISVITLSVGEKEALFQELRGLRDEHADASPTERRELLLERATELLAGLYPAEPELRVRALANQLVNQELEPLVRVRPAGQTPSFATEGPIGSAAGFATVTAQPASGVLILYPVSNPVPTLLLAPAASARPHRFPPPFCWCHWQHRVW